MDKKLELLIEDTVIEISKNLQELQGYLEFNTYSLEVLTYVVREQNKILQQNLKLILLILPVIDSVS